MTARADAVQGTRHKAHIQKPTYRGRLDTSRCLILFGRALNFCNETRTIAGRVLALRLELRQHSFSASRDILMRRRVSRHLTGYLCR